mmetsp:Transcript_8809/g.16447  ORF Transcript_8809/g.16447 Transcript_8809/m.16447 type:complete len:722 (+) Transcript_8809:287-2452(+)
MSSDDASAERLVSSDDASAERLWKEDMAKMQLGTRLLFINDFQGAETVFHNGMNNVREGDDKVEGLRDLRGAFALQYALVSVIKGVASLANDQLDECLQRLWHAEELSSKDSEWLGKSVVRGICTLMGGVIQVLQHSFVKGVYNVLKSWMWIKVLQGEAVDYEGKEREVVRSCALFTLGIFNLLLSLLPASMLKAATFLSGFEGDRGVGLRQLLDCWKEDGMFSPWAALLYVAYQVDTKTFIDEKMSDQDIKDCEGIFSWAHERYPNSVFFSGTQADFEACRKNVALANEIMNRAAPYAHELKALEWALNYKRGVYELTDLQFANAARYFETSLEVYIRVGRRSMVPFMAMYAALCYQVVAEDKGKIEAERDEQVGEAHTDEDEDTDQMDAATAAAHAEEMLCLVAKYRAMNKDNWGRQDKWAFRLYQVYCVDEDEENELDDGEGSVDEPKTPWPLLDISESMVVRMRCTRWMNDVQTAHFLEMLQKGQNERTLDADEEIRLCAVFAQVLLEQGEQEPALEWCEKGLSLQGELSPDGKIAGFAAMLLYLKALNMYQRGQLLTARYCLDLLDAFNKKSDIFQYILFKANILKKQVNQDFDQEKYETVTVAAGDSYQEIVPVTKMGTLVEWDWACLAHDIQFTAIFRPNHSKVEEEDDESDESDFDESEIVMVSSIERHEDKDGPAVGYFEAPSDGTMIFEWDNRYSFLRSKQIIFRTKLVQQ